LTHATATRDRAGMTSARSWRLGGGLASLLLAAACGGDDAPDPCVTLGIEGECVGLPTGSTAEDVDTAFNEAADGVTIAFGPGTYTFTTDLSLSASGVTVIGDGPDTILDFSGQVTGAQGILATGDDVTFQDLTDNGAYGLYPVQCVNVRIEAVRGVGASDAGIYVGQSTTHPVKDSEAFGNVAGIEIENSSDAEVVGNHAHDNTGGILVFNLPGLRSPITRPRRSA
jgi:parallel beta-helix repeat protein